MIVFDPYFFEYFCTISNTIKVKRRKSLKLFSCLSKPATKDDDLIEEKEVPEMTEDEQNKDPSQLAAAAAVLASATASTEEETK